MKQIVVEAQVLRLRRRIRRLVRALLIAITLLFAVLVLAVNNLPQPIVDLTHAQREVTSYTLANGTTVRILADFHSVSDRYLSVEWSRPLGDVPSSFIAPLSRDANPHERDFKLIECKGGELFAIVASSNPNIVLFMYDGSTGFDWPPASLVGDFLQVAPPPEFKEMLDEMREQDRQEHLQRLRQEAGNDALIFGDPRDVSAAISSDRSP